MIYNKFKPREELDFLFFSFFYYSKLSQSNLSSYHPHACLAVYGLVYQIICFFNKKIISAHHAKTHKSWGFF